MESDTTGNLVQSKVEPWITVWPKVPVSIEPLSGLEIFAAQQVQSKTSLRVKFRWRPGIVTTMRLRHVFTTPESGEQFFNIDSILPDVTGMNELVLMCTRRDAEGFRTENG
jgi:head-tail adaptor